MTHNEKNELLEEIKMLKILLDFHIQNKERIAISDVEFEGYVNAVLDRLNELTALLNKKDE
jgi:ribosome assembly protein YihI (activator of Der GTPase)